MQRRNSNHGSEPIKSPPSRSLVGIAGVSMAITACIAQWTSTFAFIAITCKTLVAGEVVNNFYDPVQ
jgi:hypothetical protein